MTRLLRTRLADLAEQAIRFGRGNVSRERAAELFADLDIAQPWDEELAELVLARFSPAEPPAVPGLDWLPAVQADAAVLVGEAVAVLDEPKPRHRSLSEKIEAANAEAAKFNAEFPPGTPVEYWSGAREGDGRIGHTKGEAFSSSSGQAVVFLDNASSYHALSHVRPLTAEQVAP